MAEPKEIGQCALCRAIIYANNIGKVEKDGTLFCSSVCKEEATGEP